jgi:hypothetical protein
MKIHYTFTPAQSSSLQGAQKAAYDRALQIRQEVSEKGEEAMALDESPRDRAGNKPGDVLVVNEKDSDWDTYKNFGTYKQRLEVHFDPAARQLQKLDYSDNESFSSLGYEAKKGFFGGEKEIFTREDRTVKDSGGCWAPLVQQVTVDRKSGLMDYQEFNIHPRY